MSNHVRFLEAVIHHDNEIEMMFMQPKQESGEVFMKYFVIEEHSSNWTVCKTIWRAMLCDSEFLEI